jgi:hypothetical protein
MHASIKKCCGWSSGFSFFNEYKRGDGIFRCVHAFAIANS